jgi:pilus assembly protein CpaC
MRPGRTSFSLWRDASPVPQLYDVTVLPDLDALEERLAATAETEGARVSMVGGRLVLEGTFPDTASQEEARALAEAFADAEVLDLSQIAVQESVQVEVEVIAVAKSAMKALGVNLAHLGNDFSFASTAPTTLESFALNPDGRTGLEIESALPIANAFNILLGSQKYDALSVISALQNSNYAETLARPTLVVRSGDTADFLVGGEIPIPVVQGGAGVNSVSIEYKRFGVSLNVQPTVLKGRRIALKLKPAVSELDYANAVSLQGFTVPALRTRETETTVELGENESLILAGLNLGSGADVEEKVPLLGDLPILGVLFKRQREAHEEQELIVAVTPRLVRPGTQDRSAQYRLQSETGQALPGAPAAGPR